MKVRRVLPVHISVALVVWMLISGLACSDDSRTPDHGTIGTTPVTTAIPEPTSTALPTPTSPPIHVAQEHYFIGLTHAEEGRFDQAIDEFTEAIHLNPKSAESYYNRGRAYGNHNVYTLR